MLQNAIMGAFFIGVAWKNLGGPIPQPTARTEEEAKVRISPEGRPG